MGYTNRAEPIGKYSHEQIARHRPAPRVLRLSLRLATTATWCHLVLVTLTEIGGHGILPTGPDHVPLSFCRTIPVHRRHRVTVWTIWRITLWIENGEMLNLVNHWMCQCICRDRLKRFGNRRCIKCLIPANEWHSVLYQLHTSVYKRSCWSTWVEMYYCTVILKSVLGLVGQPKKRLILSLCKTIAKH